MSLFKKIFSPTPRYSPMLRFLSEHSGLILNPKLSEAEIQELDAAATCELHPLHALISTPRLFTNVELLNESTDVLRLLESLGLRFLADSPTPHGSIFSPEGDRYIDSWEALAETLAQVLPKGTLVSPPFAARSGFIARVSPDCVAALEAEKVVRPDGLEPPTCWV